MDKNTKDKLTDKSISSQTSLVDKLIDNKKNAQQITYIVPGGKSLMTKENPVDKEQLTKYLKTWLKRVNAFESVTLNFVKEIPETLVEKRLLRAFEKTEKGKTYWESYGRDQLAELIANIIHSEKEKPLSILVDSVGIYAAAKPPKAAADKPGGDNWEPHLQFIKKPGKHTILL